MLRADLLLSVMTRDYGSSMQLQKNQLLRDADLVVLNKADLPGTESAFGEVHGVMAERGEGGRTRCGFCRRWPAIRGWTVSLPFSAGGLTGRDRRSERRRKSLPPQGGNVLVPHRRRAYLAEIAEWSGL